MTERQARYVERVCQVAGVPFDPSMTPVEAQALITEHGKGWLSRTDVRKVPCPACKAKSGEPCIGHRGQERAANHRERVKLATSP